MFAQIFFSTNTKFSWAVCAFYFRELCAHSLLIKKLTHIYIQSSVIPYTYNATICAAGELFLKTRFDSAKKCTGRCMVGVGYCICCIWKPKMNSKQIPAHRKIWLNKIHCKFGRFCVILHCRNLYFVWVSLSFSALVFWFHFTYITTVKCTLKIESRIFRFSGHVYGLPNDFMCRIVHSEFRYFTQFHQMIFSEYYSHIQKEDKIKITSQRSSEF